MELKIDDVLVERNVESVPRSYVRSLRLSLSSR